MVNALNLDGPRRSPSPPTVTAEIERRRQDTFAEYTADIERRRQETFAEYTAAIERGRKERQRNIERRRQDTLLRSNAAEIERRFSAGAATVTVVAGGPGATAVFDLEEQQLQFARACMAAGISSEQQFARACIERACKKTDENCRACILRVCQKGERKKKAEVVQYKRGAYKKTKKGEPKKKKATMAGAFWKASRWAFRGRSRSPIGRVIANLNVFAEEFAVGWRAPGPTEETRP